MLKRSITFKNLDGESITRDFYLFLFAVARWGQRNLAHRKTNAALAGFYSLSRDGDSGTLPPPAGL